jgi:hypothetical protein
VEKKRLTFRRDIFPSGQIQFFPFFLSSGVSISFRLNFSTVLILNKSPQGFFQAFEILLNFNIIERN